MIEDTLRQSVKAADLWQLLKAVDLAMAEEGIVADTRRRVINRLVHGHPDGVLYAV